MKNSITLRYFLKFSLIISLIFIYSCSTKELIKDYEGYWQSVGYGKVLNIVGTDYEIYDITSQACLPAIKGAIRSVDESVKVKNDTLFYKVGYDIYAFTKMTELPELCTKELTDDEAYDPELNFEVFAENYKTHYAFLKDNNIDFDAVYKKHKEQINPSTSQVQLYTILQNMLEDLKDNQGFIAPSEKIYTDIELENYDPSKKEEGKAYSDFEIADLVTDTFLEENLTKFPGYVEWGKMSDIIGYIQIKAMWLHANIQLNDSIVNQEGFVNTYDNELHTMSQPEQTNQEISGIQFVMDQAMEDLADTNSIVIDVRFNGGGNDDVALEILKYFNSNSTLVATKKARLGDSYTDTTPIYLEAGKSPYTRPVFILTSKQSSGATDFFAMASMSLPNVKRIGSTTQGAFSDALSKALPNGWYFSLSNERYQDAKGNNYESLGVPVDHDLNYPENEQEFFNVIASDLVKDKEQILKLVLAPQR